MEHISAILKVDFPSACEVLRKSSSRQSSGPIRTREVTRCMILENSCATGIGVHSSGESISCAIA